MDLPNKAERILFLQKKQEENPVFSISDAEIENIAVRSTGMCLSNLSSVLELAHRMALRRQTPVVDDAIFEEAFESFLSGEEKKWTAEALERVARHEAGHALLYWLSGETPSYLTIVSRSNYGGYMQEGDKEGKKIYTKNELLARIRTALGGRAAEIVCYGKEEGLSTGASGDLYKATTIAKKMVCVYGMSDAFGVPYISKKEAEDGGLTAQVNDVVRQILTTELESAVALIAENREKLDRLVQILLLKNHIIGKEIDQALRGDVTV